VIAAYVDTSYSVAIAFAEAGHQALIRRLGSVDGIFSSPLLEAELRAALTREGVSSEAGILHSVSWVLPSRPLSLEIGRVLSTGYLRGADLWHLASALYLSPNSSELLFLSSDKRQNQVARALGFQT